MYKSTFHQLCPVEFSVALLPMVSVLEWVAISSSDGLLDQGIEPKSSVAPALQVDSLLLSQQENQGTMGMTIRHRSLPEGVSTGHVLENLTIKIGKDIYGL